MTPHAIGAGRYAPLRVLIHEAEEGKTCVELDLPSSLCGQIGDGRVDRVAESLEGLETRGASGYAVAVKNLAQGETLIGRGGLHA